jgi:ParB family chromosome partitioning protein
MERAIKDIIIGDRYRKEMGDIGSLAKSIEDIGLMHPVVIDSGNNLIAGARRIRAFEQLGRETIPVSLNFADHVGGCFLTWTSGPSLSLLPRVRTNSDGV